MIKTSEQINEIAKALSLAQGEIENVVPNSKNPHYKNEYADLGALRKAIREPMARHGLSTIQFIGTVNGKSALFTRLMHTSGQWIEGPAYELLIDKPTMQGLGSATTYAKRHTLSALFGLAEADDDGNEADKFPMDTPHPSPAITHKNAPVLPKAKTTKPVVTDGNKLTREQLEELKNAANENGWTPKDAKQYMLDNFSVSESSMLSQAQFCQMLFDINSGPGASVQIENDYIRNSQGPE